MEENLGFLCDRPTIILITTIDDEEVVLTLSSKNKVIDAEPLVYAYSNYKKISGECKLVVVNVQQLYHNRFYPRTYYTIFKLINDNFELGYLLEQHNGSTGYTAFYPCSSYSACRKIIRKEEDLD